MDSESQVTLIVSLILLAGSAFFVASEYGLVSSRRTKIEALAKPLHDRALAEKERDEAMVAAIDSLTDDYAMPLRLRFLDEMPLDRIAAFMGVPLSTVKWRIHHGKKLLRAKVEATN